MTEAELLTFKRVLDYELRALFDNNKSIENCRKGIIDAENIEEIQVNILNIFRNLYTFEEIIRENFNSENIKFLEPKKNS